MVDDRAYPLVSEHIRRETRREVGPKALKENHNIGT